MLGCIDACGMEVLLPAVCKAGFQLLEQAAAVLYLLDHLEFFGDDLPALAICIHSLHGRAHLALQLGNAAKAFKVIHNVQNERRFGLARRQCPADLLLVHNVQNERRFGLARRQCPADLLLVHNGRDGWPEQDHAGNILDVYPLVEHINAEQQLEGIAFILFKLRECPAGGRILRVGRVEMNVLAHASEPFPGKLHHILHVLITRAEHDIFAASLCNVLGKHLIQPLGLLQGTAQGV